MKLILVATPQKLEQILESTISNIEGNAKKLAFGVAATAATMTAPVWAGAALIGASAIAATRYGLSKDGVKEGIKDAKSIAGLLLNEKKQPIELQEKLAAIAEHLKLPVPIVYIPLDQAHFLQFDIGDSPSNGSFYISHPFLEDVFIRPAEFAQTLAKEKEAAFIHLASTLGAKSIHLNSVTINQTNNMFGGKIKPHILAPQLGIKASFDAKGEVIKEVYKQYHPPKRPPYVPKELEQWVKIDPALRQLAVDRMELNLASVKVSLLFKEVSNSGTQIATALAGKKFEIGGQIQKIHESTWHFFVEFFDKNDL